MEEADHPRYPIRVAARRAGLTTATVRAWERRYGAVEPARTETDRRLYSDTDIERLQLLRALVASGQSVSDLATLTTARLRTLVERERGPLEAAESDSPRRRARGRTTRERSATLVLLRACDQAVREMDAPRLQTLLSRALVGLPSRTFMDRVLVPLLRRIGRLWERGQITVAHEHAASVAVRQVLGWMLETFRASGESRRVFADQVPPAIIVATPQGERHEFGALMVSVLAAAAGWRVSYLGADLPADDIARAIKSSNARAVAVSIVSPHATSDELGRELWRLRRSIGQGPALLVGGTASAVHTGLLEELGAVRLEGLGAFDRWLAENGEPSPRAA